MDKMNTTRGTNDSGRDNDFDFYLKNGIPTAQVMSILKSQGKDEKEIDAFIEKYEEARKRIKKVVRKFVEKIQQKYGHLEQADLISKGMKHAAKHDFTPAETEAFKRFVLKGDTDTQYLPFQELGNTEMSKFMGFASMATTGQTISVKATDHPALNEIARLFEVSRPIHSAVKTNVVIYRDCSPDALMGTYNKDKDNVNLFIHPVIVALFLKKIPAIERRMLMSNIGRMVIQRTQAYFQSQSDRAMNLKYSNWSMNDMIEGELMADLELAYDIARDPNSLNYFSDESPMANLLKRYTVQVELWKNVLSLRQGKYYSRSDSYTTVADDGIMGLYKVLASYSSTYFDSPDLYQVHDEGTLLRKLLAVFALRPTWVQISSLVTQSGFGYSNIGQVARSTFINTPINNVKLPMTMAFTGAYRTSATPYAAQPVSLNDSLNQSDWFIEHKTMVPKQRRVIYSDKIAFFYVNRRYQSPIPNINMGFRYLSIPSTMTDLTSINTTAVDFTESMVIGNGTFNLASVVVLNELLDGRLATGCSTIVISHADPVIGRMQTDYYYYNPLSAGIYHYNPDIDDYQKNYPIESIPRNSNKDIAFLQTSRAYGTIFVYEDPSATFTGEAC